MLNIFQASSSKLGRDEKWRFLPKFTSRVVYKRASSDGRKYFPPDSFWPGPSSSTRKGKCDWKELKFNTLAKKVFQFLLQNGIPNLLTNSTLQGQEEGTFPKLVWAKMAGGCFSAAGKRICNGFSNTSSFFKSGKSRPYRIVSTPKALSWTICFESKTFCQPWRSKVRWEMRNCSSFQLFLFFKLRRRSQEQKRLW